MMYLRIGVRCISIAWSWSNVQSMNDAWNVTEDGKQDVDQKITAAATLEKDA